MQGLHGVQPTGVFRYVRRQYTDTDLCRALACAGGKVNALQQKLKPRLHLPHPARPRLFSPCCLASRQSLYNLTLITTRTRYRIRVLEVGHYALESLKLSLDITNIGVKFERTFVQSSFDIEQGRSLPRSK